MTANPRPRKSAKRGSTRTYLNGRVTLHHGDSRDVLRSLPDNSIESCVCDPPYALVSIVKRFGKPGSAPTKDGDVYSRSSAGFMGQQWDTGETAFAAEFWAEVLRVLKPGGHLVAFSGTRTYHRMAVAIEDAGFEIRDQIWWTYGSGFPKSHDVAKAITKRLDPMLVIEIKNWLRDHVEKSSKSKADLVRECGFPIIDYLKTEPHADAAGRATWHLLLPYGEKWKRAKEVLGFDDRYDHVIEKLTLVSSRRDAPAATGEIYGDYAGTETDYHLTDAASQWKGWGSALKPAWEPICLARKPLIGTIAENVLTHGTGGINIDGCRVHADDAQGGKYTVKRLKPGAPLNKTGGNWRPEEGGVEYHGEMKPGRFPANLVHDGSDEVLACFPESEGQLRTVGPEHGDKISVNVYGDYGPRETFTPRNDSGSAARFFFTAKADQDDRLGSTHPTVKPVNLMQWLVRLVTPKGGTVLDPFAGTGTTGEAAWREGFNAILIEREAKYCDDIERRMQLADNPTKRAAVAASKNNLEDPNSLPLFAKDGAT